MPAKKEKLDKKKRVKESGKQRILSDYIRDVSEISDVRAGIPLPLGTQQRGDGVNFAIFSRSAERVWLEFYDEPGDEKAARVIELDPSHNRTGDVWHVWVKGVRPSQLYAYRLDGPYEPENGLRFNKNKLILDPLATAITHAKDWDFGAARGYDSNSRRKDLSFSKSDDADAMPKCVYTHEHFHWKNDQPPRHSWSDTVIYETHVRGCTIHSSSGVEHPGTYRGLTEKIPYFKYLGITAIELMPVMEFNETENPRKNPDTGEPLKNYWGYDPVTFLAPKGSYGSSGSRGQQKLEFKEMVKTFHQAGIEVILDVVLNHTAEGNEFGPTLSFRGIENPIYYMLDENDRRYYKDYTGTGNTFNANHPVVRNLILDILRYWAMELHVDGFRFDLASVLGRDIHGNLLSNPPLLEQIAEDPILRDIKIIAEAWDAGGAYQVGSFSEKRWAEWNGRYRDDVRRFWRGDPGMMGAFASRICGSEDIYQHSGKGPESSINFVTCHDGFTLNDLVSYEKKHNEANGHENRDGSDSNYSANYGQEGPADDPEIEKIRIRQIKNFLLTLFISRGIPMLLGGDECRRTQQGNNNAYCQDNEISWYNWNLLEKNREIYRFAAGMIQFRREHEIFRREEFYSEQNVRWFNPVGSAPDWSDSSAKCLGMLVLEPDSANYYLIFNASEIEAKFNLPASSNNNPWRLTVDTSLPTPNDFHESGKEQELEDKETYTARPYSAVILLARNNS
ncbi:MAG: glycogen debranching protein GlgX [Calditrichia bacterium]